MSRPVDPIRDVPTVAWEQGAAHGWKLDSVQALDDDGVLVMLEQTAAEARFGIELRPRSDALPALERLRHVQVAHRGPLDERDTKARAWQMALMVFLARIADRALEGEPGQNLQTVFGFSAHEEGQSPTSCWYAAAALNLDVFATIRPCCLYLEPLRDETGRPFRVPGDSLERVWNSADVSRVQQALTAGVPIAECERCWKVERYGGTSRRMGRPLRRRPGSAGDRRLRMLSIFASSRCNLRCRTCNASASSSIAVEHRKLLRDNPAANELLDTDLAELAALDHRPWIGNDDWSWLTSRLGELERLDFLGGEPLLLKEHFDLLETCVRAGEASHIGLSYSTNGTQFPERARELWPHFEEVELQVSLDAIGARFEYLRHPARWSVVEDNIRRFAVLSPNVSVSVNATISAYNIFYLSELVDWASENELVLKLNPLGDPRHMDPRVLSPKAKRAVRARLATCAVPSYLEPGLQAALDGMDSESWSDSELSRFFAHTRMIDEVRGERFEATFPELYEMLADR